MLRPVQRPGLRLFHLGAGAALRGPIEIALEPQELLPSFAINMGDFLPQVRVDMVTDGAGYD